MYRLIFLPVLHSISIREELCCWKFPFSIAWPLRIPAEQRRWTGEQRMWRTEKGESLVWCQIIPWFINSLAVVRLDTSLPFPGLESQANWDALPVFYKRLSSPGVNPVEGSVDPSRCLVLMGLWVQQREGCRASRRWGDDCRDVLMATQVRFLTGYTLKISRRSVGYFWYFPNNVISTITFKLNFLPFVYAHFSKLRRRSTSVVIFLLNCSSALKKSLWKCTCRGTTV